MKNNINSRPKVVRQIHKKYLQIERKEETTKRMRKEDKI